MDLFVKILFIVLFFAATIFIGFYCRKKAQNSNDFVLGGRNVGPWLSAFAYGTSYFSAVIFIGYAGSFGLKFGVAAFWIGIGNALIGSWLAWALLGRKTRIMTQHLNSSTMPDFFAKRFKSEGLRIFAAIIIFVFLIPYTAALYNGLADLFNVAFSPAVPYWVWILIIAVATGAYVIVGGLMSTALNSFIQGLIMLVGLVLVVIFALQLNGGLMGSFEALSEKGWQFSSLFGSDPVHLIFVILLTSLGCWGLPQMVGKFYSIKNENQIRKGSIISTVFAIIVAGGCYFLGGFAQLFKADAGDTAIIPYIVSQLPMIIIAIVIVLVLAASMSTLSGLVHTSASTVTFDLLDRKKTMPEKKKMTWLRSLVVVFIVISAGLAIFQTLDGVPANLKKDIASLMGISWGAISGAFIGPFFYGLYWKKTTKASVYASFISGLVISIVGLILSLAGVTTAKITSVNSGYEICWFNFADSIYMGVLAMAVSFIIVPIVSKFTKAPEGVEEMFKCYSQKVVVTSDIALTEEIDKEPEETELEHNIETIETLENSSGAQE